MVAVVGVDACKKGWIAVEIPREGEPAAHYLKHIGDVTEAVPSAQVIGVDIPIGLPAKGRRRADIEARALLGARGSSVFWTPPRQVLVSETHALATRLAVEMTGAGISQQSYALAAKVLEVDGWLPSAPCPVVEVHPEASFAVMLRQPAKASKKSWAGVVERRDALAAEGIVLDHVSGAATLHAAVDDMLDAAAAAWTALRVLSGLARCLPDPPEIDSAGRSVAIWA